MTRPASPSRAIRAASGNPQVEVLFADHQNKPDVGSNIARQWYDQGVDAVVDVPTSSVALAINGIAREKNKVFLNSGAATSDLTGPACSPNTVHFTYDTYMLAKSTGGALVRAGGDSWFFVTADYAFGHALERDTANFVKAAGGKVNGQVRTPFPGTSDFSSFLVQAQASRAKVVGLANAGQDTTNCIKQAAEFGITRRGIKLASLLPMYRWASPIESESEALRIILINRVLEVGKHLGGKTDAVETRFLNINLVVQFVG